MGTKRDVFSGKFDSRGRKIMKSSKSMQNADTKSSAIKNSAIPKFYDVTPRDQLVTDVVDSGGNLSDYKDELINLGVNPMTFSTVPKERIKVIKSGKDLDILIHDKNECVREAVAQEGYGLDKLINDEDDNVRAAVANQGYKLDNLMYDESDWVRGRVAAQGHSPEVMIRDNSNMVRELVLGNLDAVEKLVGLGIVKRTKVDGLFMVVD